MRSISSREYVFFITILISVSSLSFQSEVCFATLVAQVGCATCVKPPSVSSVEEAVVCEVSLSYSIPLSENLSLVASTSV